MFTKQRFFFLISCVLLLAFALVSCDKQVTYAERREKENKQIEQFLKRGAHLDDKEYGRPLLDVPGNIQVISEAQFIAQDSTTDVSKNQYVLFAGSGVYAQVVRRGSGSPIKPNEHVMLLCRYIEYNIATDSIRSSNLYGFDSVRPDVMSLENNNGSLVGVMAEGIMRRYYGTKAPSGWLIPLPYLKLGRQLSEKDEISKLRIIVPSTEGHAIAEKHTQPYFYEITFERSR